MKGLAVFVAVVGLFITGCAMPSAFAASGAVTLVDDGKPACCVVVSREVLTAKPGEGYERQAAEDLAGYLKKMSGAEIRMAAEPVEGLLPIYLGSAAGEVKLEKQSEFGDAYVVDVQADRIILTGESDRATCYAAAHLLNMLGVRWYAPTEIGECVPTKDTLTVEVGRTDEAPDWRTRSAMLRPPWKLRNRLGPTIAHGHSWSHYWGGEYLEDHPEYYAMRNGNVTGSPNLSSPEVAKIFANGVAARLRKGPHVHSASLCAHDGLLWPDDRPESLAMDSGRVDPIFKVPSASTRMVKFFNRICGHLEEEFPDRRLGFYVYVNYSMPPEDVKPHPMLVPIITPIHFNRYSRIGNPNAPTSMLLKEYIHGWVAVSKDVGCYLYNFNLADCAVPFTRRLAWSEDIPNLYKWGLRYFITQSWADDWHSMVPGNYVIARLLWDVDADVEAILDEFYPTYYGPAAEAIREYDRTLENAYESTDAFAGNLWAMHRILTPEVMAKLDGCLREAERLTEGDELLSRRVRIARHTLEFARLWFAARDAINRFDLTEAEKYADEFVENYKTADKDSPGFFGPYVNGYFESYHLPSFRDGGRVAREGETIYKFPDRWKAFLDDTKDGKLMGLYRPEATALLERAHRLPHAGRRILRIGFLFDHVGAAEVRVRSERGQCGWPAGCPSCRPPRPPVPCTSGRRV